MTPSRPAAARCCRGCPYPRGAYTNAVAHAKGWSRREIDWLLVSPDTPVATVTRHTLPGISTHLALLVDADLVIAALRPVDPCGRRFQYQRATPVRLEHAASIFGLVAWWAAFAGLPSDAILTLGHSRRRLSPAPLYGCPALTPSLSPPASFLLFPFLFFFPFTPASRPQSLLFSQRSAPLPPLRSV